MCANVTSAASSSPVASTGRSLFSRLTNPLKSRTRNLTDFHIRPLEPHRQYRPGDLVKGAVVLTVVKPIRITHLTVALHGFVRVFKHPNGVKEPIPTEASLADGNRTKSQYFGNGYASLFQDEVTLCGEGRLEAGVYEFNFELEFPSKGIPTSIDFERGTISYMITSTITRPTSITATSSCDRKISLVENVDIGLMVPPRPRTISLEPISRRPRRRKTAKNADGTSQESNDVGSGSDATRAATSPRPEESASQVGSLENNTSPRSPVPSEIHSEVSAASDHSTVSSSTGMSFRLGPVPSSAKSARNSQASGSKVSMDDKTITATIELLKSGCLPGDSLPLKITIKHTKAIKSMHGVIITLYRQGRIDSAPPLSLFMDINGKDAERLKHEEYYPKSKTGLGGLSLSSAGSSSVFRKDLSQTFAPIIVDPTTLTAVVNASVRVPEDVFPTISGVPGEMISFKYQVEVVVDLGGKLAGQQRHLPRVGTVTMPSNFANPVNVRDGEGSLAANHNLLAAWGGSIVDTDHIRREKSVVACLFEVTVGTSDSARKRGRGISSARQPSNDFSVPTSPTAPLDPPYEYPYSQDQSQGQYQEQQQPYPYYDQNYDQPYDEQYPGYYSNGTYEYDQDYSAYEQYPPPSHNNIHVPPPDFQEEEGLSEKERVRRAEARLLPSQPPLDDVPGPSSARTVIAPSAPPAIDEAEDDLYSAQDEPRGTTGPPCQQHQVDYAVGSLHRPLAPSAPPPDNVDSSSRSFASEDKQELERRRLLAEASAPSEFPDEEDHNGEGSSAREHEPSAPVLTEEDEYGGHYPHHSQPGPSSQQESLPRYER